MANPSTALLYSQGKHVSGAVDGNDAYSQLECDPVDVIISELDMPELNGMGLLKKRKGNVSLKNIPFIMFTASRDEELNKKAMESGAVAFILKPSTPKILQEKLNKII